MRGGPGVTRAPRRRTGAPTTHHTKWYYLTTCRNAPVRSASARRSALLCCSCIHLVFLFLRLRPSVSTDGAGSRAPGLKPPVDWKTLPMWHGSEEPLRLGTKQWNAKLNGLALNSPRTGPLGLTYL